MFRAWPDKLWCCLTGYDRTRFLKMVIDLQDRRYTIEFRHIRQPQLGKHAEPIKSVTTCVIIAQPIIPFKGGESPVSAGKIEFTATDISICSAIDNFGRAQGRARSLAKILERWKRFAQIREQLWARYFGIGACPTCGGRGWMLGAGWNGESCAGCRSPRTLGGTGWKGGVVLYERSHLVMPVFSNPPKPPRAKRPPEEVEALKAAGAEKRQLRRARSGGSAA